MKPGRLLLFALPLLWLAVLASAVTVVFVRHEARNLFTELERLSDERDELNIEWGQLQIEQSTWATHARIEQVAADRLSLVRPQSTEIFVIERP